MDPTPLPHVATAASLVIGVGLRMAAKRQGAATDPGTQGKLAGLTLIALLAGVGVAFWTGNPAALGALDPDAIGQAAIDVSAWVLGLAGPLLAPAKEPAK